MRDVSVVLGVGSTTNILATASSAVVFAVRDSLGLSAGVAGGAVVSGDMNHGYNRYLPSEGGDKSAWLSVSSPRQISSSVTTTSSSTTLFDAGASLGPGGNNNGLKFKWALHPSSFILPFSTALSQHLS